MIGTLVNFVIYLLIVGCVCWLLTYLNDAIPVPEPFHNVIRIAILVFGVIIVILLLLSLVEGTGTLRLPKLT